MVALIAILGICIIILVVGIVAVTWSDAPPELKSFGSALIWGGGVGSAIIIAVIVVLRRI